MPILWEWLPARQLSKSLEFRNDGLNEDGTYGTVHVIDTKKVPVVAKFTGRGFTPEEADQLFEDADVPGATLTLTDHAGDTWTGVIQDLDESVVKSGTNLKVLNLTLANAIKG